MSLDGAALLAVSKNPIVSSPAHREYALSRRQATCTLVSHLERQPQEFRRAQEKGKRGTACIENGDHKTRQKIEGERLRSCRLLAW
jgi:hypothetical protein